MDYLGVNIGFLLTRLMRGATTGDYEDLYLLPDFYSRASCEARLSEMNDETRAAEISTHAPHARRDSSALPVSLLWL